MRTRAGGTRAQGSDNKSLLSLPFMAPFQLTAHHVGTQVFSQARSEGGCDGGSRKEGLWGGRVKGGRSWKKRLNPEWISRARGLALDSHILQVSTLKGSP